MIMLEHPVISNLRGTGHPDGMQEDKRYICPVCGEECESLYKDWMETIVGCENCITKITADTYFNEEVYPDY